MTRIHQATASPT